MADQLQNEQTPQEVPVYLFTGFLEAGKTKFIQETLEDKRFDNGERTLLLVCEEGELEYDLSRVRHGSQVRIRTVENEEDLSAELLSLWAREIQPERVVVEYNGMWMLDTLYRALPAGWMVYQEFCFADAGSFLSYNANMRQLVYDKLRSCDLVVFNRFDQAHSDVMPFHKIVRGANRGCSIAYEDLKGKVKYDEIEDPLPFDKEADVIEIQDRDYALWYRDMGEELKSYDGKVVRFKAQTAAAPELPEGTLVVGRQMMNCCAADLTFAGLIATGNPRGDIADGDWVMLTAQLRVKKHVGYGSRPGPVLMIREIAPAAPPEEEVATFY